METARALAGAGADVTIAVRNVLSGNRVADELNAAGLRDTVAVGHLDLAGRTPIAEFVNGLSSPLRILVNNAGVMASPLERTPEGWESQFATNHLGHFAPAQGLHDTLTAADPARIVAVSSTAHLRGGVNLDDSNEAGLNAPPKPGGVVAYALDPQAAERLWNVPLRMLAS